MLMLLGSCFGPKGSLAMWTDYLIKNSASEILISLAFSCDNLINKFIVVM